MASPGIRRKLGIAPPAQPRFDRWRAVDDSAPSIETTETGPEALHTATATLTPVTF